MRRQGSGGSRQEIEQIDPLGLVLVQGGEGGQVDQQQRAAANPKRREDPRDPAGEQGEQPSHHPTKALQAP